MRTFFSTAALLTAIVLIYAADAQTVTVTTEECTRSVRHIPAAHLTYEPAVDVRGRKIVPVDAGGGLIRAPLQNGEAARLAAPCQERPGPGR